MTHPILEVELDENDADAETVGDYLKELLQLLIIKEESFSGKRPFGNSGWLHDLAQPLVKKGLVKGSINKDGEVENIDWHSFEGEMLVAIHHMWKPQ